MNDTPKMLDKPMDASILKDMEIKDFKSLAAALGWEDQVTAHGKYSLSTHAAKQAASKGFPSDAVLDAANNPRTVYDNGRYENQKRHISGNIVAVVSLTSMEVVTVYENVTKTALRDDQTDRDAVNYGKRLASGQA